MLIRIDTIGIELAAACAQRQPPFAGKHEQVLGLDMLEHIARDSIDIVELSIMAYDVYHACVDLVAFATFIVEAMSVESSPCGDGKRVNLF